MLIISTYLDFLYLEQHRVANKNNTVTIIRMQRKRKDFRIGFSFFVWLVDWFGGLGLFLHKPSWSQAAISLSLPPKCWVTLDTYSLVIVMVIFELRDSSTISFCAPSYKFIGQPWAALSAVGYSAATSTCAPTHRRRTPALEDSANLINVWDSWQLSPPPCDSLRSSPQSATVMLSLLGSP